MTTDSRGIATAAVRDAITAAQGLLEEERLTAILGAAEMIAAALRVEGKVLLFGNGGSASDSSHIATEFVGRFMRERRALPAIALSADQSALTAIANDYGFERVFARQIEALGRPGDVAVAISTSGRSANVIAGAQQARESGMRTIALTGGAGGELAPLADICICVRSSMTARIQEGHIIAAHVICDLVEQTFSS